MLGNIVVQSCDRGGARTAKGALAPSTPTSGKISTPLGGELVYLPVGDHSLCVGKF